MSGNVTAITVSRLNSYVRGILWEDMNLHGVKVRGEISNCTYATSGHIYFTLKDAGASVRCLMFRSKAAGLSFRLRDGMAVIVTGDADLYEAGGQYQLKVSAAQKDGTGILYERYEQLKARLKQEGLFEEAHKKPLPAYPSTVGIVTARTGKAIHDIVTNATRRNPWIQLVFCPASVQGEGAAATLIRGIRALEAYGVDVIIIGRGGGSIEELWEFNNERLARTVFDCSVPVISAVGHDSDTTIIDYVADRVASTPTAAAELAVPDMVKIAAYLDQMRGRLDGIMEAQTAGAKAQAAHLAAQLRALSPGRVLQDRRQALATAGKRMQVMMEHRLSDSKQSLLDQENSLARLMRQRTEDSRNKNALYAQKLHGLSPLRQLERGYAYVSDEAGHGVSSISQVSGGAALQIEMTDGRIRAAVEEIIPVSRERIGEE